MIAHSPRPSGLGDSESSILMVSRAHDKDNRMEHYHVMLGRADAGPVGRLGGTIYERMKDASAAFGLLVGMDANKDQIGLRARYADMRGKVLHHKATDVFLAVCDLECDLTRMIVASR
jgi:hypothetical protein